ncbi:MAG TPA: ATP-binding protein [Steroidobacteraceae bacterium]|nr:ATP-binding protein [Steroidobacteraceae bacterium]
MKTRNTSGRSPRIGLYVGLALMLPASLALEGAGLRLARNSQSHVAGAAIAGGALVCLIGGALILTSALRQRGRRAEPTRARLAVRRPRTSEEAAALAHAQKMEALGLLAGGVAHDFNNLLHVIRNSLEILQRQGEQADAQRYLEMIRRSADRAGELTRRLLAFSRRQPLEVRPLDPNELVAQMAELMRHSLGERVSIRTVLGQGIGSVATDAGQLETALLNLAINARDAMPQAGLLTIETAIAMVDEGSQSRLPALGTCVADQYVVIAVSDTGTGMSPEIAARACEPFFTTKEPGQGTGLGLSQVAGFARQSAGHVRISSEPGKGTTVRLYLPALRADAVPSAVAAPSARIPERASAPDDEVADTPVWPIKEAAQSIPLAVGAGPER